MLDLGMQKCYISTRAAFVAPASVRWPIFGTSCARAHARDREREKRERERRGSVEAGEWQMKRATVEQRDCGDRESESEREAERKGVTEKI